MQGGAGERHVCSGFPRRLPPWAYSGLLWWLETQCVASFINNQQETQEILPLPHNGNISFIPSQQLKSIFEHWPFLSLKSLTVIEMQVKMNAHWWVVFPLERFDNAPLWKQRSPGSRTDSSFVVANCCKADLMPFSGIVGGNTIIFLAPVSWQPGPEGRSCARQLPNYRRHDRNVGTHTLR